MDRVSFVTVDPGKDLTVAFALARGEPGEVVSLILLRTPAHEHLRPPAERGVTVSHEEEHEEEEDEWDLLDLVELGRGTCRIVSQRREYLLDVSSVERDELQEARKVLWKMNFDGAFDLVLT